MRGLREGSTWAVVAIWALCSTLSPTYASALSPLGQYTSCLTTAAKSATGAAIAGECNQYVVPAARNCVSTRQMDMSSCMLSIGLVTTSLVEVLEAKKPKHLIRLAEPYAEADPNLDYDHCVATAFRNATDINDETGACFDAFQGVVDQCASDSGVPRTVCESFFLLRYFSAID